MWKPYAVASGLEEVEDAGFEIIHTTDPQEFISTLESLGTPVTKESPRFVYRGVGDVANHRLVPTLLRRDQRARMTDFQDIEVDSTGEMQIRAIEISVLRAFYDYANRSGLPVPATQMLNADRTVQLVLRAFPGMQISDQDWLPAEMAELAALAQHYGLPTRLLDWTQDPMVASFFAAESAFTLGIAGFMRARLGVWLLDLKSVLGQARPLQIIYPPYATNPNLAAQQGLLSHWHSSRKVDEADPVDDAPLVERFAEWNSANSAEPPMKLALVTLDASKQFDLSDLLRRRNVHHARLFPGYDGARRAVEGEGRRRALERGVREAQEILRLSATDGVDSAEGDSRSD